MKIQERKNVEITLPSGIKVEIIPYFTRGEKMEIQKAMFSYVEIRGEEPIINPEATLKMRDKTLEVAIKSINGENFKIDTVHNISEEDGDFLEKAIENQTAPKKKS